MHETLYLTKSLQLIEQKVNRGSSGQWTYEDFKRLQKLIFEASSINLSTHTLERLYGKLKTHKNYKPQSDTKNALALFLGYSDWENFKAENPLSNEEIVAFSETHLSAGELKTAGSADSGSFKRSNKKRVTVIALLFICIGIATSLVIFQKKQGSDINFRAINAFGAPPHTVKFAYNLSELEGDNFAIAFSGYKDTLKLLKTQNQSYKSYLRTGRFMAYLLSDKKIIAETPVYIQTPGWIGSHYSIYENEITKGPLPEMALRSGGKLHTPFSYLPDTIENKNNYFVCYTNIRDFKVDGDNASFETRFRANPANGSKVCHDMWFKLMGTKGILKMHFLVSGCFGYVQMVFSEKVLKGYKDDLSPFSIDLLRWRKAKLEVQNKNIQISLDDSVIYKTSYSNSIGKIVGIEVTSKTSGETDYVKLYNAKKELVYEDDFGGRAED